MEKLLSFREGLAWKLRAASLALLPPCPVAEGPQPPLSIQEGRGTLPGRDMGMGSPPLCHTTKQLPVCFQAVQRNRTLQRTVREEQAPKRPEGILVFFISLLICEVWWGSQDSQGFKTTLLYRRNIHPSKMQQSQ